MQPGYGQQHPFPQTLDAVPAEALLTETFAFTPGALAVGAILGLAGLAIALGKQGGPRELEDMYLPAGCILGALLFGAWEILRRRRKTSVAFHGDRIGVYRKGQLTDVAYRSQIAVYQLSIINTVRELLAFGIVGLFTLGTGVLSVVEEPVTGLAFLGLGVGFSGAFISSIYARIACRHFFVPKSGGTEQVMFTRGALGRFGI